MLLQRSDGGVNPYGTLGKCDIFGYFQTTATTMFEIVWNFLFFIAKFKIVWNFKFQNLRFCYNYI